MRLSSFFFTGLCMLLMLSSCNSSKIAFGNSYYFKQTPKEIVTRASTVPPVSAMEFTTSTLPNTKAMASRKPVSIPQPLAEAALRYEHITKELKRDDLSRTEKQALKSEKRAQKKAFKAELKKFAQAPQQDDIDDEITGLLKAGIIVGAAGVVMLLTGILVSGGAVLVTLGGIFLAVGVVLILLRIL